MIEQNVSQINVGIIINVNVSVKKYQICEKDYISNAPICNCKNLKYLASVMDDLTIVCDEVREPYNEEIKVISLNFNEKKVTCKTQSFYILLAFLLITVVLLTAVIIYCYLIKYQKNIY